MKLEEYVALVKSVKYKVGSRFNVDADWARGSSPVVKLTALFAVRDAGNPENYISITQGEMYSLEMIHHWTPADAVQRLREFVMAFERHDFGEWFEVSGMKPFDPHAGVAHEEAAMQKLSGETYGRGSQ